MTRLRKAVIRLGLLSGSLSGSLLGSLAAAAATPVPVAAPVQPGIHEGRLTAFGAERGGNADGSIPPYEGGITPAAAPSSFKPGSGRYPDPYPDEKPLYIVDARNAARYDALLSVGSKALLAQFPDYQIPVYRTHRPMAYPAWVLKNTARNAEKAELVGTQHGDGVSGAYGGIPFPVPKDAYEVMWNQALRYIGPRVDYHFHSYFVDSIGHTSMVGDQEVEISMPWYDSAAEHLHDWNYYTALTSYYGPPAQIGTMFLQKSTIDAGARPDTTWVYAVGVRRVRVAPDLKYDAPAASIGGVLLFDEIGGFAGRMDRFDFRLVGKREMLVPYDDYTAMFSEDLVGRSHENCSLVRWEKHRVWVVDAVLKPGQRHIYGRRTYYIDEDTWQIVQYEAYDQSGAIYRVMNNLSFVPYDRPRMGLPSQIMYDLQRRNYAIVAVMGDRSTYLKPFDEMRSQSRYTPDAIAGLGLR